jgi:hypothetical protein
MDNPTDEQSESSPGIDGVDVFGRSYDWPPEREAGGQCMDCGFLSRRSLDSRVFAVEEVSVDQRKRGDLFHLTLSAGPSIPWCFVRPSSEVDLQREVEAVAAQEREKARAAGTPDFVQVSLPDLDVLAVLTNDRKCPEWIWYTPTLSPAEHRAERTMLRLKEMERGQVEDRRKIAEANLKIAEAVKDISAKTDDFTRRWTMVAVGLALLSLAIVIVSYFLPHLGEAIVSHLIGASPVPLP